MKYSLTASTQAAGLGSAGPPFQGCACQNPWRALALTQEEFAARFRIPLGTLRDWEQGRSEPDQPAKAYLTVIARDPQGVERALHPVRS
jgi:DNA-binding transcriptional regulator YiaG